MKKMFAILSVVILGGLSLQGSVFPQDKPTEAPATQTVITDEEYKVYSDTLPFLVGLDEATVSLVIYDHTSTGLTAKEGIDQQTVDYILRDSGKKLDAAMVKKFNELNAEEHKFENKFPGLKVILITAEEMDQIFDMMQGDGWEKFYAKYPGSPGSVSLSRVAISDDGKRAFFYFGNQRHWLAGVGYYVFAEKKADDKWVVTGKAMAWIS